MASSNNALTRTCTACSLQKPLSAFLQVSGDQGTSYGNLCATCRGAGIKDPTLIEPREDERSTTTSSGLRIGAKEKNEIEKKQKDQLNRDKETQKKAASKQVTLNDEKSTKEELKEQAEKKHRDFINTKARLLNYQSKPAPLDTQALLWQKNDESAAATATSTNRSPEATKLQEAITLEQNNSINTQVTFLPSQQSKVLFQQNNNLDNFLNWLGPEAALTKSLRGNNKSSPTLHKASPKTREPETANGAPESDNEMKHNRSR
jgi:hypothetical protein